LPIKRKVKAIKTVLFSFSFRNVKANAVTKINIVLCMREALAAVVNCKPLKYNKNGTEPPINPITTSFAQSRFFNLKNSFDLVIKINESKKTATRIFFKKVKTLESIPPTAYLFK